jgi:hypothetical protein
LITCKLGGADIHQIEDLKFKLLNVGELFNLSPLEVFINDLIVKLKDLTRRVLQRLLIN